MSARSTTHEVLNQPPPFEDVNLYATDAALIDAVEREGGGHAAGALDTFGKVAGSAEALEALVAWLHEGPPMARVDSVEVDAIDPAGQDWPETFLVR